MALHGLLQANLNYSAAAQDLFVQRLAEWGIGLVVAAEPYLILSRPNWLGDLSGLVAIVGEGGHESIPLSLLAKEERFVAAKWGEIAVVEVHFSPNRNLVQFEEFLKELAVALWRLSALPLFVAGDAKSAA